MIAYLSSIPTSPYIIYLCVGEDYDVYIKRHTIYKGTTQVEVVGDDIKPFTVIHGESFRI